MDQIKTSFLFILGVCLVIISSYRGQESNANQTPPYNRQYLTWDGSHITVINNKYSAESLISKNGLPPELCPLFFHPIPLNSADRELLITLPGVGPATAELILRKRLELGRIISNNQLLSIKGIGEKTAAKIEQYSTYDL